MALPNLKSQALWLQQARKKNEMGEQAVSDKQIVNSLIQQHPEFSQPFNRLVTSTKDHPLSATKFLNYTFYGDSDYAEPPPPPKRLSLNGLVNSDYLQNGDPTRSSTADLQGYIGKPEGVLGAVGAGLKGGLLGSKDIAVNAAKSGYEMLNHPVQTFVSAAAIPAGGVEEALAWLGEDMISNFNQLRGGDGTLSERQKAPMTPEREQFRSAMKTMGITDLLHGIFSGDKEKVITGADTALNFAYQHPLETGLMAEGAARGFNKITGKKGMKAPVPSELGGKIIGGVKGAGKAVIEKIPGVQGAKNFMAERTAEIKATEAANTAYKQEAAKPKTHEDLSVPSRSTSMDIEAAKNRTAIIENGKIIGYKPNSEISATLKKVVTDPNNVPQSLGEIQSAKGTLSETARAELTKQTAGKIHEFQTKRYQDAAIKNVRKTLSEAMQTDEAKIAFDDAELPKVQQKAAVVENKYAEFLRQSAGEAEVAKLDLRQWLDRQIPDSAYSKSLAELPVATRSLIVFRRALSVSIDASAKSIGGNYAKIMKEITNLYGAEETVSTHIPKPETLMQRYTLPGEQVLPNEVPPTVGEMVKTGAKKLIKPALKGAGFGLGAGLLP